MEIVLVGPYSRPAGGLQIHLVQLERFLVRQGHTCFVVNLGKDKTLKSAKVVSPRSAFQVAFVLLKKRDHVCHLHFGGRLHTRLLLLALFSSLVFHRRCAVTIHSGGLPGWGHPKNFMKKLLLRLSFARCGSVICVNHQIAEYFNKIGIEPDRTPVIPPFSFENILTSDPLPDTTNLFMKGKEPLICNIGCLEDEYDLDLLLRAFGRLVRKRPKAGLIMIGSGSLCSHLGSLISRMNLQNQVMMTGDLDHSVTLRILASSDIFVRSARYDGDCISLKEAMKLGVPAIATDTGIRPPGALLFPIGDEEALLKLLEAIASSPSRQKIAPFESDLSSLAKVESILSEYSNG